MEFPTKTSKSPFLYHHGNMPVIFIIVWRGLAFCLVSDLKVILQDVNTATTLLMKVFYLNIDFLSKNQTM
jgi:hypothetical protein